MLLARKYHAQKTPGKLNKGLLYSGLIHCLAFLVLFLLPTQDPLRVRITEIELSPLLSVSCEEAQKTSSSFVHTNIEKREEPDKQAHADASPSSAETAVKPKSTGVVPEREAARTKTRNLGRATVSSRGSRTPPKPRFPVQFHDNLVARLPLEGTNHNFDWSFDIYTNTYTHVNSEGIPIGNNERPPNYDNDSHMAMIEFSNCMFITNHRLKVDPFIEPWLQYWGVPHAPFPPAEVLFQQGCEHAEISLELLRRREQTLRKQGLLDQKQYAQIKGYRMMLYAATDQWSQAESEFLEFDRLTNHDLEQADFYERFSQICFYNEFYDLAIRVCRAQLTCYGGNKHLEQVVTKRIEQIAQVKAEKTMALRLK